MRFNSAYILAAAIALIPISAAIDDTNFVPDSSVSGRPVTNNISINKRMEASQQGHLTNQLYRLTDGMMSAVGHGIFSYVRFKREADEYATQLSKLDLQIKQLYPPNEDLLKKLGFTHRVLREMNEAVQYESIFSRSEGMDYRIAICMVQINLSLLMLLDDRGIPSPHLPIWYLRKQKSSGTPAEYAVYLSSLKNLFRVWQSQFGEDDPVVPPVKALYELQVQKAALTFEKLNNVVQGELDL